MSYFGAIRGLNSDGYNDNLVAKDENGTPLTVNQIDLSPSSRFSDLMELPRGAFYGVGVAGAQTVMMIAGGVTSPFGTEFSDPFFSAADEIRDYWGSGPQRQSGAANLLFGLGDTLGKVGLGAATGGSTLATAGFAGAVQFQQVAAEQIQAGKPLGAALGMGATSGAALGIGVALPFSAHLLRGSGALFATVQRLGYGVASNVIPGIGQRAADKAILNAYGFTDEAAAMNILDPTAIATDAVLGLAFGGMARWADVRNAKAGGNRDIDGVTTKREPTDAEIRAAMREQRAINNQALEAQGKAVAGDPAIAAQTIKAADQTIAAAQKPNTERVTFYANQVRAENPGMPAKQVRKEALDLEQAERESQIAEAKAQKAEAEKIQQQDAIEYQATKERLSKQEEASIESAKLKIDDKMKDAALASNLHLRAVDSSLGRPVSIKDQDAHIAAMQETQQAIAEGRPINPDIIAAVKTSDDPMLNQKIGQNVAAVRENLTPEEFEQLNVGVERIDPVTLAPASELVRTTDQVKATSKAILDTIPDDMKVATESGTMTVAEMKEAHAMEIENAIDELNTIDAAMSCLIGVH